MCPVTTQITVGSTRTGNKTSPLINKDDVDNSIANDNCARYLNRNVCTQTSDRETAAKSHVTHVIPPETAFPTGVGGTITSRANNVTSCYRVLDTRCSAVLAYGVGTRTSEEKGTSRKFATDEQSIG